MSALWTCIIPRYINQLEKHEKTNFIKEVEVYASPLAAACGIELWIWTALDTLRLPDINKPLRLSDFPTSSSLDIWIQPHTPTHSYMKGPPLSAVAILPQRLYVLPPSLCSPCLTPAMCCVRHVTEIY